MPRYDDARTEREYAEAISMVSGFAMTPRGRSLYRFRRFDLTWTLVGALLTLDAWLLGVALQLPAPWTALLTLATSWTIVRFSRHPFAEMMLCVAGSRVIAARITSRSGSESRHVDALRGVAARIAGLEPETRIEPRFPSDEQRRR